MKHLEARKLLGAVVNASESTKAPQAFSRFAIELLKQNRALLQTGTHFTNAGWSDGRTG
jgi:hypothetical protein